MRLRSRENHNETSIQPETQVEAPSHYPEYIFGLHEAGGESLMVDAGRPGWVLGLAEIGLDGTNAPADFSHLAKQGLGVIVRLNHGYGSAGTLPLPEHYEEFAEAAARYVARSSGSHIWIVGNEPNHEQERPQGRPILPHEYAQAYKLTRDAIRSVPGHETDQVLLAGSAPWNATTTYTGNEKGDWVRYFSDVLKYLPDDGVDGFALHTYTHDLNPDQISGDFLHTTPGYRHLRNEFRTYRDYMNAIPDHFRHLPVFITETDPTIRGKGWNPGNNVGWAQAAYREIAVWNSDPTHQPIQSLILYRWPLLRDQPEWAISTRPGIIEDFQQALHASPSEEFKLRMPSHPAPVVILEPGTLLPADKQWHGLVVAPLGLNLRTGPSTQHRVIQILPDETAVKVLAEVDDWLYVSTLGKTGYIAGDFVLRHKPGEGEVPEEERDFLRDDEELMTAPLAPPEAQQIVIDPSTATWTEIAVANTWNRYGALIARLCKQLDIDLAVAVAVLAVESGGDAFGPDGQMTIRFENHIFFDLWGKLDPERFSQHFRFELERPWNGHQWRPEPDQLWRDFHGNHKDEWQVFDLARTFFNPQAAKQSISMGAPQIMGFNYSKIGYDNVDAMFYTFQNSENSQIIGFFDFVLADPLRLDALRNGDYLTFAASYNGGGQASLYASLIEDAVKTFRRLIAQTGVDAQSRPPALSLPLPHAPLTLAASDPRLYEAWREHIVSGFHNNQKMFERILDAFMNPYRTTVRMYQILFAVGIVAFIAAVGLSLWTQEALFGLIFGGLSLSTFAAIFFSQPLRSLEENLNFITWLGVIYNSYWARLLYALDVATVQQDLEDITEDFVNQMDRLLEKSRAIKRDHSE